MGSIRAALSGNTTGRQLLLNLKGAGDFLTWGQIYKPFPHTHTHSLLPFICALEPCSGATQDLGPGGASPVVRSGFGEPGRGRTAGAKPSILLPTPLPGAFCRGELQQRSRASSLFFFPLGFLRGPAAPGARDSRRAGALLLSPALGGGRAQPNSPSACKTKGRKPLISFLLRLHPFFRGFTLFFEASSFFF